MALGCCMATFLQRAALFQETAVLLIKNEQKSLLRDGVVRYAHAVYKHDRALQQELYAKTYATRSVELPTSEQRCTVRFALYREHIGIEVTFASDAFSAILK